MTLPTTMRAVLLTGHGDLDKLEYREDVPIPRVADDEVLIEVAACGVNNTDINTRTGWYAKGAGAAAGPGSDPGSDIGESAVGAGSWGGSLHFPRIQGADPVGRIVQVGSAVPSDRIGQRVLVDAWMRDPGGHLDGARYLGSEQDGGFAEYVAVPAVNAHPVDSAASDVELASFPCSYATAEHMLERARVAPQHWVLVTGASGGVGGALVQLAKRRGARVIAVAGRSKLAGVEALGADFVLPREEADLASAVVKSVGAVDVFADVVGGPLFAPLLETVRRGGQYTVAGAIGGPIVDLDLRTLYLHDLTMHGATVLPAHVFANLVGYIERNEIKPVVAATYPLERLADAQVAFVEKNHVGALVIEVKRGA